MRKLWQKGWPVRIALLGLGLVLLLVALAHWIAPYGPLDVVIQERLQPPSLAHPFGTDRLGRDVLSRVLHGGRLSLTVGMIAVAINLAGGILLGLAAGFFRGRFDLLVMRVTDIFMAMPGLIFALFIVAVLGPGLPNVMLALGIGGIPGMTRMVRGSVLAVQGREFVEAAQALGASRLRIMFRHILPNVLPPILVLATLDAGGAILAASGLSYIGLGAQPPTPEWGAMLTESRNYLTQAWWLSAFPGLAIMTVVLCLNIVGDAVRDILDPKLRGAA